MSPRRSSTEIWIASRRLVQRRPGRRPRSGPPGLDVFHRGGVEKTCPAAFLVPGSSGNHLVAVGPMGLFLIEGDAMKALFWLKRHGRYRIQRKTLGDWQVIEVSGRFAAGEPEEAF